MIGGTGVKMLRWRCKESLSVIIFGCVSPKGGHILPGTPIMNNQQHISQGHSFPTLSVQPGFEDRQFLFSTLPGL